MSGSRLGFINALKRTSKKARRTFAVVVALNTTCVVWVHYDQNAQFARMHAGVELDEKRLEKKLLDYGIDQRALYRDLPHYSRPEHKLSKQHQPTPPELIPELAELGVTRDSTFVPGMQRPEVDVEKF